MIVVLKNSLRSSKLGYMTALGVGLAIFIHVAYCIAGVGLIISQSITLFSIIKTVGAFYLLYIAYQLFRAEKEIPEEIKKSSNTSLFIAFREGFVTNALNPKATLFFLSVFTQVISVDTSIITQSFYGIMMAAIVTIWFMILTTIMNFSLVKKHMA